MNALYIFITTDRPDQYLNPIVHCIEKGTRKIVFVLVEDEKDRAAANLLKFNVYNLLQRLSDGFYRYYVGDNKDKEVDLSERYNADDLAKLKARYQHCLSENIDWSIEKLKYIDLRKYISSLRKKKSILIDVTAVSKVYIGDIFACSLLEGIDKLFTFELEKLNFDEPWKVLIHELKERHSYNYKNLVETPVFKESSKSILIRTTPLLFSIAGTILFVTTALIATSIFGFGSDFIQVISVIGTALSIISFFLIYFPIRKD